MSLIAKLIEAGTPADLVAEVAMTLARAEVAQEAIETRRSKDRERQQRKRGNVTSRDNMGQDVTPSPLCPPLDKETPPTPPKEINPPPISPQPFPRLPIADAGLWADFLKNRKAKRLPNTATAHERLKRDLTAMAAQTGWTEAAIFRACVERGWGAIYDPTDGAKPTAKPEAHKDFMRKRYAEAEPPPVVHAIE